MDTHTCSSTVLKFNTASRPYRIKDNYKTRTPSITFSNPKVI